MPMTRAQRILFRPMLERVARRRAPKGTASQEWDNWTSEQRCHFLRQWCKLSDHQVAYFAPLEWHALSGHVRKSVKRFFDTAPVLDMVLGAMRYQLKKAA
jgi:hypothetical protein